MRWIKGTDVRYNALFFTLGVACLGLSFVLMVVASLAPYFQGGQVARAVTELALVLSFGIALGFIGFLSLGIGAITFAQNYEPITEEARLVAFSSVPYGIFLLAIHFARLQVEGMDDYFAYSISRDSGGTPTLIVATPESFGVLGPYFVLGAFGLAVFSFGLARFLANMKIVKEVGTPTITLTKSFGTLALLGQVLMLIGWPAFTADNPGTDWFSPGFAAYFIGYLFVYIVVPILGVLVAYRAGQIFWDAAKTVRYLSDFRKRASAVAEQRAKTSVDDRKWWEKIADEK